KIIGMEIGPNNAANQVINKPITPPNRSELNAITIVIKIKLKVVVRAISNILCELKCLIRLFTTGRISLVITEEIVLASEAVMDKVFENNEAISKPNSPGGRNSIAIREYDCSGLAKSGRNIGAANIGNRRISGHIRYK